MKYPYRFKTETEFIEEFGNGNWRHYGSEINYWPGNMDYLFGVEYPFYITRTIEIGNYNDNEYNWGISWWMLIKNKPIKPNYKPKQIIL